MWRRSPWLKAPFIPKTTSHFSPLRFAQEAAYRLWAYPWPSPPLYTPSVGFRPLFSKSKIVCVDASGRSPTGCAMIDAAWRQEKGKLCFIKRKDKHYISNKRNFSGTKNPFSLEPIVIHRKQEDFFSKTLLFLPSSPLFFEKDVQALTVFAFRRPYAHV